MSLRSIELTDEDKAFITRQIRDILAELSVKLNSKGGIYLSEILYIMATQFREIDGSAEALRITSQKHGINTESVRAAVRYAVTQAWEVGDPDIQFEYFGRSVSFKRGKPTEAAFIKSAEMKLRHRMVRYFAAAEAKNQPIVKMMME